MLEVTSRGPKVLSALISKAIFEDLKWPPAFYHCRGIFLLRAWTLHMAMSYFTRFLLAHSANLSRSSWQAVPLNLESPENLRWVYSMFFSRQLIKTFNRTGPRTNSCSIPLITGFQVNYDHKLLCSECNHPGIFEPINLSTQLEKNPMHTWGGTCVVLSI